MRSYGRYEMKRSASDSDALVIFILGMGILLFVMGPCTGLYSVGLGFVGWVASWVLGITLRVFLLNRSSYDERERYPY
jgi:hypothetical protein